MEPLKDTLYTREGVATFAAAFHHAAGLAGWGDRAGTNVSGADQRQGIFTGRQVAGKRVAPQVDVITGTSGKYGLVGIHGPLIGHHAGLGIETFVGGG